MIRLHLPDRPLVPGATLCLEGPRHHYLAHVLRVRPGARLELFPGDGTAHAAEVREVGRRDVTLLVGAALSVSAPSPLRVTLVQALLRGARLDSAVQKATELGVAVVALAVSARSQVVWPDAARPVERLRAIAVEAAEQCGRVDVPEVVPPQRLAQVLATLPTAEARFVLWEGARTRSLGAALREAPPPRSVQLVSGPEGGLDEAEVAAAEALGFRAVGLGPRILRAETAPLAALAVLQFAAGDLA